MDNLKIPEIAKKVTPAVITIVAAKSLEDVEKQLPAEMLPYLPFKKPFMEIPESEIDAHGHIKVGGGSGFIVGQNGIILTNRHVVSESNAEYTVIVPDDKYYIAKILARDQVNDIAILKIDAKNLPCLELGDSSKIELGEQVLAFGNALGIFKNTVSSGIISGLSRSIRASANLQEFQDLYGLIQTDAAINPGNSGGPLLDSSGKVIGINTAVVLGAQNLGFAIPINSAKKDLEDLKKYGKVRKPYLGIRYMMIDEELRGKYKLPFNYGAIVLKGMAKLQAVIQNSPADKAGMKEGDIILEADGERLTMQKPLQEILNQKSAKDILKLKIYRNKKSREIKIKLTERK